MDEQRAKTMIGFAARARQCVAGATAVESAIRGRKAKLVLLDKDCAENTKKGYQNLCGNTVYGDDRSRVCGWKAGTPVSGDSAKQLC